MSSINHNENQKLINFLDEYVKNIELGETLNIKDIKNKDDEVLYLLQNMKLVFSFIFKGYYYDPDIEDLFQECVLAFMNSVEKFDKNADNAFSTYAFRSFINAVRRFKDNNHFTLSTGLNFMSQARIVKRLTRSNYSDDYIKEKLNINDDVLFQLKRYIELNNVTNLDAEIFNDNEGTGSSVLDLLSNPEEVMDYVLDNFDKEDIYKLVFETSKLTEREKRVIYLRFYQNQSLQQVGKEFGVSRERIRQIQEKALGKLRLGSTGKILSEYIKNN